MIAALFYALYSILSGFQQGIIVWLLSRFVAPRYQQWIDAAFHKGGALIYGLLVAAFCYYQCRLSQAAFNSRLGWLVLGIGCLHALLARVTFFDVSLNAARAWFSHQEGQALEQPFAVGSSAYSDKVLRQLATRWHLKPQTLRRGLFYLGLVALSATLLFLPTF